MSKWKSVLIGDGTYEVPYRDFIPDESPHGVIIIIPALGVRARFYTRLAESFQGSGFAAYAVEMRGIGESSLRASHNTDWGYHELAMIDTPAIIRSVKEAYPDVPVYLFGHSLGGHISYLYLSDNPEHIDGAIIAACGSPYAGHFDLKSKLQIKGLCLLMSVVNRIAGFYPGHIFGFAGREAKTLMNDWAVLAREDKLNFKNIKHDAEEGVRTYDGHVVTFTFENDELATPAATAAFFNRLDSASHEHHEMTDESLKGSADHFNWTKSPAEITKRILSWHRKRHG